VERNTQVDGFNLVEVLPGISSAIRDRFSSLPFLARVWSSWQDRWLHSRTLLRARFSRPGNVIQNRT